MPTEIATYVSDLVPTNPAQSDPLSAAATHMRMIKGVLKNTLQGFTGPLTNTSGSLQVPVDGTSSALRGTPGSPLEPLCRLRRPLNNDNSPSAYQLYRGPWLER